MARFKLVPDYDSPNKMYVHDMKNGNKVIAIYYDTDMARLTVDKLNEYYKNITKDEDSSDWFKS